MTVVLSLFPGIGLLDRAFEAEGFTVVRGPDVLWGGDIREFHPPAGKFDGIIGGPPCQAFSRLAHMVRQNGYEPKFGNLIPEFERCVIEAEPQWFVMEEVPDAPLPCVDRYFVDSRLLNNRELGEVVSRERRWSFGFRGERRRLDVETVTFHAAEFEYAATGGSARKNSLCGVTDAARPKKYRDGKGGMPWNAKGGMPWNAKGWDAVKELIRKQGLPDGFADHLPFTAQAACKAIGNGVPQAMGRAIAKAVREAISPRGAK